MKIYLDDDSVEHLLVRLLRAAGHDVLLPADLGRTGFDDSRHLAYAIVDGRSLLTHNHDDFLYLHELVLAAGGHHPGVLVVRKDNDRTRDLRAAQIVRAIRNLLAAGVPVHDEFIVLNQWR